MRVPPFPLGAPNSQVEEGRRRTVRVLPLPLGGSVKSILTPLFTREWTLGRGKTIAFVFPLLSSATSLSGVAGPVHVVACHWQITFSMCPKAHKNCHPRSPAFSLSLTLSFFKRLALSINRRAKKRVDAPSVPGGTKVFGGGMPPFLSLLSRGEGWGGRPCLLLMSPAPPHAYSSLHLCPKGVDGRLLPFLLLSGEQAR